MRSSSAWSYPEVRAGCYRCSVRFSICAPDPSEYLTRLIHCPACGQADECYLENEPVTPGDGPIRPGKFRFRNRIYDGLPRLEWRLLACLWGRETVSAEEAIEHLYGHDAENKEEALKHAKNRLNKKLTEQGFPGSVHFRAGHVILEVFKG